MDVIENRNSLVYVGRVERVAQVCFDPGHGVTAFRPVKSTPRRVGGFRAR